jgi:hypothetical protein
MKWWLILLGIFGFFLFFGAYYYAFTGDVLFFSTGRAVDAGSIGGEFNPTTPTITGVSPVSNLVTRPVNIEITGSGFTPDTEVYIANQPASAFDIVPIFVDSMRIHLTSTASPCSPTGGLREGCLVASTELYVATRGLRSNSMPVTFDTDKPKLNLIYSPIQKPGTSSTTIYDVSQKISIVGDFFTLMTPGSFKGTFIVAINANTGTQYVFGQEENSVSYRDMTQLSFYYRSGDLPIGTYYISVVNPGANQNTYVSGARTLSVVAGCVGGSPVASALSPSTIENNEYQTLSVNVNGFSLASDPSYFIAFDGSNFQSLSSSGLNAITSPGLVTLSFSVPAYAVPLGGYGANTPIVFGETRMGCFATLPSVGFSSVSGSPVLTDIRPAIVPVGVTATLAISGTGFYTSTDTPYGFETEVVFIDLVTGAVVQAQNLGAEVNVKTHGSISLQLPSSFGGGYYLVVLRNMKSSGSGYYYSQGYGIFIGPQVELEASGGLVGLVEGEILEGLSGVSGGLEVEPGVIIEGEDEPLLGQSPPGEGDSSGGVGGSLFNPAKDWPPQSFSFNLLFWVFVMVLVLGIVIVLILIIHHGRTRRSVPVSVAFSSTIGTRNDWSYS